MRLIDADALHVNLLESEQLSRKFYKTLQYEHEQQICGAEIMAFTEAILMVKEAPTIEAEPVRHGEWEYLPPDDHRRSCTITDKIRCKVCNFTFPRLAGYNFKLCPECGTKMDAKKGANHDRS